ncbi:MAG: hypothetical protein QM820_55010 [Minicystis sp.]
MAAPSATPEASCGHDLMVSSISVSDGTKRGEKILPQDPQHVRHLVARRQALDVARLDAAQEAVEDRAIGLQIEALDIHHPALVGVHPDGDAVGPGALADVELDEEVVALLDQEIELAPAEEEDIDVLLVEALGEDGDVEVGIDLEHLPRGDGHLGDTDGGHRGAQTIHVRERQRVVIGEAEGAAHALLAEGQRRRLPDREAHDAQRFRGQDGLLLGRDLVLIAGVAELAIFGLGEDVHQAARPGVMDPGAVFEEGDAGEVLGHQLLEIGGRELLRGAAGGDQLLELEGDGVVGHRDAPALDQGGEGAAILLARDDVQLGPPRRRRAGVLQQVEDLALQGHLAAFAPGASVQPAPRQTPTARYPRHPERRKPDGARRDAERRPLRRALLCVV